MYIEEQEVYPMKSAVARFGRLNSGSWSATYWLCDFRQVFLALPFSSMKWVL